VGNIDYWPKYVIPASIGIIYGIQNYNSEAGVVSAPALLFVAALEPV